MMAVLRKLASLKLTLVGMALLAIVSLAAAGEDGIDTGFAALPILVLTVNLLAALLTNRSFRTQTGLLVFHVGLLLVFAFLGLTVLTRFDGYVEVVQGGDFDTGSLTETERGWLHRGRLENVRFTQDEIQVGYRPGLLRQQTRSTMLVTHADGRLERVTIGDRDTVVLDGYRFAATFNKGFAVVFGWHGDDGARGYGSVHFPSYPEHDWDQRIDWTTPAGQTLLVELELAAPPLRLDQAWTLGQTNLPYTVRVTASDTAELAQGESLAVNGGRVSVEDLRMWMAYRVDYLPMLPWMLAAAFLAVAGLALHYRSIYMRRQPARAASTEGDALDGAVA